MDLARRDGLTVAVEENYVTPGKPIDFREADTFLEPIFASYKK